MSITAKGRKWEILHSLWIGWTFTFGFFNWIAFLYTGFRAKQRRWIFWGIFYLVPSALNLVFAGTDRYEGSLGDILVAVFLILALASFVHAFVIRKEYLLRLETLQRQEAHDEISLKRRLAAEYGTGFPEEASSSNSASSPPVVDATVPDRGQKEIADRPTNSVSSSTPPTTASQRNVSK